MVNAVLRALGMALAMGWQIMWPLILGFAHSAVVHSGPFVSSPHNATRAWLRPLSHGTTRPGSTLPFSFSQACWCGEPVSPLPTSDRETVARAKSRRRQAPRRVGRSGLRRGDSSLGARSLRRDLLRSIEEVGLLQQLPRFAMQRVFVSHERL
jgi:hypothetical protein